MKILITGGAGFVGSNLAFAFREKYPQFSVAVVDNLHRRGSELNLRRFKQCGITFHHGDIRNPADLMDLPGSFDTLIEASAEPSVHAGAEGAPRYLLDTNLSGTLNCLEFVRKRVGSIVFLSTSRVYSIAPLRAIQLVESATRLDIAEAQTLPGIGTQGIDESFSTHLPRSLYGASKLASEIIIQEYVETFGVKAVIDRCGVIAGPGQFGKVDQGVYTWWVASHYFGWPLSYTGFGGAGKQVRDLLHPTDLFRLVDAQIQRSEAMAGDVFNVGGGLEVSSSMLEFSNICQEVTGREVQIGSEPETKAVDIPLYLSDFSKVARAYGWSPEITVPGIAEEIAAWIRANDNELRAVFRPLE